MVNPSDFLPKSRIPAI